MKSKKIIFFDADGTIWYPKNTKSEKSPDWIYTDKKTGNNYLEQLVLMPSTLTTLRKLKKLGYFLILLSRFPHPPREADILLKGRVKHFKLEELFDEFYTSRDYLEGKGEVILKVLKEKHISKSKALMVGDSYRYDYLSAKRAGVDALLIKSQYMEHPPRGRKIQKVIKGLKDIIDILN